jgi:hypothetical protein
MCKLAAAFHLSSTHSSIYTFVWLLSLMDKMKDSDSFDTGSIPVGATFGEN